MSVARIPELLAELEPQEHAAARELVRVVLELHGEALAALMKIVSADPSLTARIARDERIGAALLLHGLHPQPPEERIRRALRHLPGVTIERIDVTDGGELRMQIQCVNARPGGGLRERIEQAVWDAAPELNSIVIEGLPAAKFPIPVVVGK